MSFHPTPPTTKIFQLFRLTQEHHLKVRPNRSSIVMNCPTEVFVGHVHVGNLTTHGNREHPSLHGFPGRERKPKTEIDRSSSSSEPFCLPYPLINPPYPLINSSRSKSPWPTPTPLKPQQLRLPIKIRDLSPNLRKRPRPGNSPIGKINHLITVPDGSETVGNNDQGDVTSE